MSQELSSNSTSDKLWFGQPRGLSTLFFTEMWERFSFYGLRALLILFMTATASEGGLGFSIAKGGSILGLYTAGVYLLALPGGWIADRLIGARRAVFIGGVIIAAGHFSLAVSSLTTFYLGLLLIVVGTGLLKPNVSTIVGELYPDGGARRDAGFSIFYMGINVGAFLGPLFCGYLGQNVNWHLGFALAGVGMVIGLVQYTATGKYLGEAGHLKVAETEQVSRDTRSFWISVGALVTLIALVWVGVGSGLLSFTSEQVATGVGVFIVSVAAAYFLYHFLFAGLTGVEKKGLAMIAVLFVTSAVFWSGFEQASSSMNLFADSLTDRDLAGWEVPTSWLQSVNPIFIIVMAPMFGVLWQRLGSRDLSIPGKFAWGLSLLGVGFLVMVWAATYTDGDTANVSMGWLVAAYFFHTCGELCLSPVGLSSVTKLAPARLVGQMMGIWFMGTALGNLFAGIAGGQFGSLTTYQLFGRVAAISLGAGVIMALLTPLVLRRWTKEALASDGDR
ncbi:MAG: peptide MFS transporter [Thermoanaerobaculia bacterium]